MKLSNRHLQFLIIGGWLFCGPALYIMIDLWVSEAAALAVLIVLFAIVGFVLLKVQKKAAVEESQNTEETQQD